MPPRVLVVDDDIAVRETIHRILQSVPCDSIVASTAAEALALARSFHPDLAIVDFVLPDEDGIALTERLLKEFPELKVTMVSGVPDFMERVGDLAMAAGVLTFVEKPFRAHEILKVLG